MPHQLEGFKLAERTNIDMYKLLLVMILATLVGTIAGFWALLHSFYRLGATSAKIAVPISAGWETWGRLEGWLTTHTLPNYAALGGMVGGFIFTVFLMMMRLRFIWFPFHPVGYAVSSSWGMSLLWVPLFIAWVIKFLVIRYGGLKMYTKVLPFFVGLILGDFVFGCIWTIIGTIFGINTYQFWGGFG